MPAAKSDLDRALTVAGRKEVEEVAESLDSLGVDPSNVITSPLKRARETAAIAAAVLKKKGLVEIWDELKPESETAGLYRRLSKLKPDSVVLVVGHEPYLSGMTSEIISGSRQARIALKKAGVAIFVVSEYPPKATGELRWLMTPKQLKKLH